MTTEDRAVARLTIPFVARGLGGAVRIALRPNDDPVATGHGRVAADFDAEAFRGFPLATAEVDYAGEGPRAWFSWIQWVTHVRDGRELSRRLDVPERSATPDYVVGYKPTFADAPANPSHTDLEWVASTWLVSEDRDDDAPDIRGLEPLAGFRWGYRRRDPGTPTEVLEPRVADASCWAELGPLLAAVPRWRTVAR